MFNVLKVGQPCDDCQKNSDTPWMCDHKQDEIPHWKNSRKQEKFNAIYEGGHEDKNMREQHGMITEDKNVAFKEKEIERLENRVLYKMNRKPDVVWMSCDPAGGGRSEMGLAGAVFIDGNFVVYIFFIYLFTRAWAQTFSTLFHSLSPMKS